MMLVCGEDYPELGPPQNRSVRGILRVLTTVEKGTYEYAEPSGLTAGAHVKPDHESPKETGI